MSTQRQAKRRFARTGEVSMERVEEKIAGDMKDQAATFVAALAKFYDKIDEPLRARIQKATGEINAVLDELPPGPLVLAAVNHVHDEIVKRSYDIGMAQVRKAKEARNEDPAAVR